MVKKYCTSCGEYSYSSRDYGEWICPTCGNDLTLSPVQLLDEKESE